MCKIKSKKIQAVQIQGPQSPALWSSFLRIYFEIKQPLYMFHKEIKMILRLFLVIALYCQGSSSQIKSITQPLPLLAGWEGSLYTIWTSLMFHTGFLKRITLEARLWFLKKLMGASVYGGHNLSPLVGIGLRSLPKVCGDQSLWPYTHRRACAFMKKEEGMSEKILNMRVNKIKCNFIDFNFIVHYIWNKTNEMLIGFFLILDIFNLDLICIKLIINGWYTCYEIVQSD